MNIDSQKLTNVLIIGIFIVLAYLAFSKEDINVDMVTTEGDKTIAVEGKSETFVVPDTASVSFSVTKKAQTTDVVMNSVNERMEILLKELTRVGVEEKDIKTTSYNVQPEYSYNDGKQIFEGYRATQRVEVVIRDMDNVSDVLATVNSADVDNVSQLTFFVDDEEAVKDELRKEAIENAKKNAQELAKDLGVGLSDIVGYSDTGNNNKIEPMFRSEMAYGAADQEVAPAIVPTGENQFVSHVTITYKID